LVVGWVNFRNSGFTAAVLRGAEYRSGATIAARLQEARGILDATDRCIVYVYAAELDKAGHAYGWESRRWTAELESLDSAVGEFIAALRKDEGFLVTADHGVLDVPQSAHILFDTDPGLIDGVRFIAGEPRCLQLHIEPDASEALREALLERWRASEGSRAWVVGRAESIEQGWFGPVVDPRVVPRIGDILVAARKRIAYYDSRVPPPNGRSMVGQHGSWSDDEIAVPLLRFGAWER
jgi:predicted AlkP superfamily pyrophosphatase or phosphodiesterase